MRERRESPQEQRIADQAWEAMLERLDGVGGEAQELARAEALLAEGEEMPVSAEWVEAMVARATAQDSAPEVAVAQGRVLPRWLPRVAAVLVAHWLLTAAVTLAAVGVFAFAKIWPSGQRSVRTLSYGNAYLLLNAEHEELGARRSALVKVHSVALYGIQTLQWVRDDPKTPPDLWLLATERLAYLRALLDAPSPAPPQLVDENPNAALLAARDPDLCVAGRWVSLWYSAALAESAILAIRAVHTGIGLDPYAERHLRTLALELDR